MNVPKKESFFNSLDRKSMKNLAFLALAAAGIVKKRPRGTLDVPGDVPGVPGHPLYRELLLAAARIVKKRPRGTLGVPGVSRERF